jgi:phosphoglycolate phosphatase-like HAD superfamily hydrolase
MRLILFDVDGTLLMAGGAGNRALGRALQHTYGLENGLNGIRLDGKTDPQIVREALGRYGKEASLTRQSLNSLFASYIPFLKDEVATSPDFRILPGVPELMATLSTQSSFALGLATGNIEEGARIKLDRADLTSFFTFGGYGSDAENRTELIRTAIERGLQEISPASAVDILLIGDTPRDVVHARTAGVRTLAVATGRYSVESLLAYKPDFVMPNLNCTEQIMEILNG